MMSATANADTLVTLFGGSGFLGRHVARALAERHYRLRVAVRRPYLAVRQLGQPGQIETVRADVRVPRMVEAAVRDAEVVINLVGILFERGEQQFDAVQAKGAGLVARAAAQTGARLVHVSAIGADADSRAAYARSKAQGEALVLAEAPEATIFRPSIIFGPEDQFFNRFAAMARISPFLPLIGGGHTRFQPVFVDDVAHAIAKAAAGDTKPGTTYELGGPDVRTFKELMKFVLATTGQRRLLVPIPFILAELQATILQFLPTPPLTPGQVELLKHDNVVSASARREGRTLEALGIKPGSIAAIVPTYLGRFRS
jgi:NADH dehydrogenase